MSKAVDDLVNNAYEKGFRLGQLKAACALVTRGYCTLEEVSELFDIPAEEIREWGTSRKHLDI